MAIDKIFDNASVDGIADNLFKSVSNSVSEVKAMQQRKAAENVQLVVQALKKIEGDLRQANEKVANELATRIASIKDGKDGKDGSNAKDGRDGRPGRDGAKGDKGDRGLDGRNGIDGKDGVSVTDAKIDFDGSLIITLSTGQEINVGEVVSPDLADKIQVISTMSTNGAVGIKDEGTSISTGVKNINFVGAAVTASASGDDVTVNVSSGTGTVTSVAVSGGTTGLTTSGGPITTTGTITLAGTLTVANGGTGVTTSTGTTNVVLSNSPTLVTPALGTPSSATLTNATGLPIATGVSGLGTGVATFLATPSSANLASAITDETGSGSLVFATSPTLVTPALGTPASGVVTNLTGTASININGTVGATTATTGAFTTLSATGVTTVQAGTAALPAITTTGDTNTGIFFPAADTIAFSEGGAEAMRIDSSGNVGIGTSSPNGKLAVIPSANPTTVATSTTLTLGEATNNSAYQLRMAYSSISSTFTGVIDAVQNSAGAPLAINPTGGNVGIGTSSPASKLDINTGGSTGTTDMITLSGLDNASAKQTYGVIRMGIENSTAGSEQGNLHLQTVESGTVRDRIFMKGGGEIAFSNGGTERMRIDSSGYLLVNQTSNATSSYVQIYGAQPALSVESTSTGAVSQIIIRNPNGTVGSISTSGSSTAFNTSSDYRLKEAITPMTGALAKVALLKPCTYKWKVDGSDGQGFIAHELDEVIPGCVTGEKDAVEAYTDEDGNEQTRPVYQGIDTSFLVATLTAAIQEQQALITALTTRITALESN